jgi:gamma-glutamyltranspeptidase
MNDRASTSGSTRPRSLTGGGTRWAVATPHEAASDAASEALRAGGNAVDAAVAAAAVLTVVYPNQCPLGGDVFALVGLPGGAVHAVNGSGAAPAGVDADAMLVDLGSMPVAGALAVTVPGALLAWDSMVRQWGRQPLARALDHAREIAQAGVRLAPGVARDLALEADRLSGDPGMRGLLFVDGHALREGDVMRPQALVSTLTTLRDEGVSAFYRGPIGQSVVNTLASLGSAMAMTDLSEHRTVVLDAVSCRFRDHEYLTAPPNSQGAYFLAGLRALEVLERRAGRRLDPGTADAGVVARIMADTARHRDANLGDAADQGDVLADLLSDQHAQLLARSVLQGAGSDTPEAKSDAVSQAPGRRSGDTVAVCVADAEGTWVSLIQSVFHAFGSGVLDPGSGIILQNRGSSFTLDRGSLNRLGPRRRPQHTLMPVLVREQGLLVGAHGTMGGRAQPQIHTQLAMSEDVATRPLSAIAAPRWVLGSMEAGRHGTVIDSIVSVESGLAESGQRSLADAGFRLVALPAHDDGAGHAQVVRRVDGELVAASDPRADGSALAT